MPEPFPVIHQNLAILTPTDQKVLPVPLGDWNNIKRRIRTMSASTDRLETFAWAAFGAAISFFLVAVTFPFSVEWSKTIAGVEHVNWPAFVTEAASCILTLVFVISGILAIRFADARQKQQNEMRGWVIEDMEAFECRHEPVVNAEENTLAEIPGAFLQRQ